MTEHAQLDPGGAQGTTSGPPRPRTQGLDRSHVPPGRDDLLTAGLPQLLDERSDPDFRAVYGLLARRSSGLDAAVARIRLSGIDLRPEEMVTLQRVRVLLTGLDALMLRSEAEAALTDPTKARNLENFVRLMEEGVIEVRSSPLGGWAPDFSIFRRSGEPWSVLVGLHWFARPFPHGGPALASIHGGAAARRTARRFSRIWRTAHDIGPAILRILLEARGRSGSGQLAPPSIRMRRRPIGEKSP